MTHSAYWVHVSVRCLRAPLHGLCKREILVVIHVFSQALVQTLALFRIGQNCDVSYCCRVHPPSTALSSPTHTQHLTTALSEMIRPTGCSLRSMRSSWPRSIGRTRRPGVRGGTSGDEGPSDTPYDPPRNGQQGLRIVSSTDLQGGRLLVLSSLVIGTR